MSNQIPLPLCPSHEEASFDIERQRILRASQEGAEPRFLLPVGAWNTSPLPHCGTDVEYQAGMAGKKKDDEEEDREGPKRLKEEKRTAEGTEGRRKEARWLIDRVRVWEVGREQSGAKSTDPRTQVWFARPFNAALGGGERWHRIAIRFPVRLAWKRETGTAGRCTAICDGHRVGKAIYKFKPRCGTFHFSPATLRFEHLRISVKWTRVNFLRWKHFRTKAGCKRII